MTTLGEGIASLGKSIGGGIEKGIEERKKQKKQQAMLKQLDGIFGMNRPGGGGNIDPDSEQGGIYAIARMLFTTGASETIAQALPAARKMYDSVNKDKGITENQRRGLDLRERSVTVQETAEERKTLGEERRLKGFERDTVDTRGATVLETDFNEFRESTGIDPQNEIEALGLTAIVNRDGTRSFRIPSEARRKEMIKIRPQGAEMEFFQTALDTRDRFREVKQGMAELGVSQEALNKVVGAIPQGYFEGVGPLSLEARFNLIGELRDHKFAVIKQKLERAFQSYRKIITGAQASDRELRMLRPLVARLISTPETFLQSIDSIVAENDSILNNRVGLMDAFGRDTSQLKKFLFEEKGVQEVGNSDDFNQQAGVALDSLLGSIGG